MYIWWLLKFLGVFFCGKQKPQNFNKSAVCSHHCSLSHLAPSLGNWYIGVYLRIFDSGPSNPTTFLGLCSPGDYRQSIESPMGVPPFNFTEQALTFTVYDCILRIRPKKVCYLTKVSKLAYTTRPVDLFTQRHTCGTGKKLAFRQFWVLRNTTGIASHDLHILGSTWPGTRPVGQDWMTEWVLQSCH